MPWQALTKLSYFLIAPDQVCRRRWQVRCSSAARFRRDDLHFSLARDRAWGSLSAAYTHVQGEGQATHLGHFTQIGDATVDLLTGAARGTWTLIAANGDMLFLTMEAYGIDPTHGVGSFTVVGGTGRFEGGDRVLRADHCV